MEANGLCCSLVNNCSASRCDMYVKLDDVLKCRTFALRCSRTLRNEATTHWATKKKDRSGPYKNYICRGNFVTCRKLETLPPKVNKGTQCTEVKEHGKEAAQVMHDTSARLQEAVQKTSSDLGTSSVDFRNLQGRGRKLSDCCLPLNSVQCVEHIVHDTFAVLELRNGR